MGGEILLFIPTVLGLAAIGTLGGIVVPWLVWMAARQWGPLSWRMGSMRFPFGAIALVLFAISLTFSWMFAFQPVAQPEGSRIVAAFEVPITSAADRADFLAILAAEAKTEGLDVKVETAEEIERWAEMSPTVRKSVGAIVYRGGDFLQTEARVSDQFYFGHVWISFAQGEDPALARRFRDQVMSRTIERWPQTLAVPVAQTGSLPHREDLVRTDTGYKINPSRLAGYLCGDAPGNAPQRACE